MAGRIAKIAAGTVTLGALLGLATAVLAAAPKPAIKLTPKSCTWVSTGKVVASGGTVKDTADGTTWKCNNGWWSQVATKGSKGGAK